MGNYRIKCASDCDPCSSCSPSPCCQPAIANISNTVINRHSVTNYHGECHRAPVHRGHVEHYHCNSCGCEPQGCGCNSGCRCSESQVAKAVPLDATLVSIETVDGVKTATMNAGIIGTILAKYNGQYYVVPNSGVVGVNLVGDAAAQTCGLHTLTINNVAVTTSNIYVNALEEYINGTCPVPKLNVDNNFIDGTASINCAASVEFFLIS